MSIFGKLLGEVIEGVVDTVELGVAVTKDVVKSPIRILGGDGMICEEGESLLEDTADKIAEIKTR